MQPAERQALYARARQHEADGEKDKALNAYLGAGAAEDAARLLVASRRYAEGAQLLLRTLGLPPDALPTERELQALDADSKRRALRAAICFARAGDQERALQMFLGLGEVDRAVELLKQTGDVVRAARLEAEYKRHGTFRGYQPEPSPSVTSGVTVDAARELESQGRFELAMEAYTKLKQFGHAARMARMLGQTRQAATLFRDAGMSYEAALCYLELGDTGEAIDNFTRVPRDEPRYRDAAIQAITIAVASGFLDFRLENFLTRFLAEPPNDERERDAFMAMSALYARHDFPENARDALTKVLRAFPDFEAAQESLARSRDEGRGSAMVYEQILKEDLAFQGDRPARRRGRAAASEMDEFPDLPDLPDLPSLSAAPPPAGRPEGRRRTARAELAHGGADAPKSGGLAEPSNPGAAPTRFTSPPPVRPDDETSPAGVPNLADVSTPSASDSSVGEANVSVSPLQDSDMYPEVGSRRHTTGAHGEGPASPIPASFEGFGEGFLLGDRYRFDKKLGEGGMAVVFKAWDIELEEHIAIKMFTREISDDSAIARFRQELSLTRRLSHPNIIRLYDIGSWHGFRYITMEMLAGRDLSEYMGTPVEVRRGVDWLLQAAEGLQGAHDKGVIHRDVKPHNIFVCDDGTIKVMDFGIAKRQSAPGMTVGNMIAGTPDYMSPEQIAGFSSVTHSTDIYALGVVAYQMFTGELPFSHEELLPLLMMHINDPPPSPKSRNDAIPAELDRIILRLLEKRPEERFSNCAALAAALRMLASRL